MATSAALCSSKVSCHFPSSLPAKYFLTSRLKLKVPNYRCSQEKLFHKHTPQNKILAQSTAPHPSQTHPHARSTWVFLRWSRCGSALRCMAPATGTPRFQKLLPTSPAGEEPLPQLHPPARADPRPLPSPSPLANPWSTHLAGVLLNPGF